MISDRINNLSSNREVFEKAAPYFNSALAASGYKDTITYNTSNISSKRSRPRKIIWFNPPFSLNVETDIARNFLNIVDRNFPKTQTSQII